ncbi:hypothetical protein BCV70DRAFT_96554 [Testicularia cyperi]|uniref:Uncharacterized protein n=1 Tax=Testicularia cyperi TaxID=1882483 RepID=A0A317XT69_9BASI|nr:hypothetical protein BCV70DRAFT_96554 [Testicularia cyperi]
MHTESSSRCCHQAWLGRFFWCYSSDLSRFVRVVVPERDRGQALDKSGEFVLYFLLRFLSEEAVSPCIIEPEHPLLSRSVCLCSVQYRREAVCLFFFFFSSRVCANHAFALHVAGVTVQPYRCRIKPASKLKVFSCGPELCRIVAETGSWIQCQVPALCFVSPEVKLLQWGRSSTCHAQSSQLLGRLALRQGRLRLLQSGFVGPLTSILSWWLLLRRP